MRFRLKERWPHSLSECFLLVRVAWRLHRILWQLRGRDPVKLVTELTPSRAPSIRDEASLNKTRGYLDGLCWRLPYLAQDVCVPRSLTLYFFARRFGLPVQWRCGVKREESASLDGHAWLVLAGEAFLERDNSAQTYTVTFSYPESPSDTPQ